MHAVEFGGGELNLLWLQDGTLYFQSWKSRVVPVHVPFVKCIRDLSTVLSVQNCLVRCDNGTFTVVVGDFGLAEKIPDYRSVK